MRRTLLLLVSSFALLLALFGTSGGLRLGPSAVADNPVDIRSRVASDLPPAGSRPALAADRAFVPQTIGSAVVVDTVVSNTDATLTNSEVRSSNESNIAINPLNPLEIVISADFGSWPGTNYLLWHSLDGGLTWTQRFTVPSPPGIVSGCPCDSSIDFARGNEFVSSHLDVTGLNKIYTGTSTDVTTAAAYQFRQTVPGTADLTNIASADSDQPWVLAGPMAGNLAADNIVVAYDDFSGVFNMRVAVSSNSFPPSFTANNVVGTMGCCVNPGHRLAINPTNGVIYSVYQRGIGAGPGGSTNVTYMLNRSTDNGVTWTLNGSSTGIAVQNANSVQPYPKFGTVNSLLGGVDHATVDATTGDVYYVNGERDGAGNNLLRVHRLATTGGVNGTIAEVSSSVGSLSAGQFALPSISVNSNGNIGLLYYQYNGIVTGFPQFSVHFATSTDRAVSWADQVLVTFLSPVVDSCGSPGCTDRQRIIGDYVQVKSNGTTWYGAFPANGAAFGRAVANMDPIFFKVTDTGAAPTISKAFGAASIPVNNSTSLTLTVTNPNGAATLNGVAFTDNLPAGLVVATPNGLAGTCATAPFNGTVTATQATGVVSLSGATLSGGASCTVVVNVTATTNGTKNNTTDAVSSTNGGTGNAASASLTVMSPPAIGKTFGNSAFGIATVARNGSTSLTFTLGNPAGNPAALTGIGFTDTFPAGVVVAAPLTATNSCGGTLQNDTGGALAAADPGIRLVGGAIVSAGSTCTITINVTGTVAGSFTNTTGVVSSIEGGTGGTASAPLTVLTPAQATSSLKTTVLSSGALLNIPAKLAAYLTSAQAYFGYGTPTMNAAGCQQIKLFKSAVTAAMATDAVVAIQGPGWIAQADAIRAAVPCLPPN